MSLLFFPVNCMKRTVIPITLAAALGAFLSGCAALRNDYVEPASGPMARLTVVNASARSSRFDLFDDAAECTGRRLAALLPRSSAEQPKPRQSIKIPATGPLSFSYLTGLPGDAGGRLECQFTGTFTPRANDDYMLEVRGEGRRCSLLFRGRDGRAVPVTEKRYRGGVTEASSFCSAR